MEYCIDTKMSKAEQMYQPENMTNTEWGKSRLQLLMWKIIQ